MTTRNTNAPAIAPLSALFSASIVKAPEKASKGDTTNATPKIHVVSRKEVTDIVLSIANGETVPNRDTIKAATARLAAIKSGAATFARTTGTGSLSIVTASGDRLRFAGNYRTAYLATLEAFVATK